MSEDPHDHEHERVRPARGTAWLEGAGIGEARHLATTKAGRALVGTVALIAALTVIGLIALWPYDWTPNPGAASTRTVPATVKQVHDRDCGGGTGALCRSIVAAVEGRTVTIGVGPAARAPRLQPGDAVRLNRSGDTREALPISAGQVHYDFAEVDRRDPLLWLVVAVALLATVALRWRGLLAVLGVALSVVLVLEFLVPALLSGRPPLLVALVSALAVMFVTLVLTNGVGAQTLAAALGVSATLALTCVVAALAARWTHLGESVEQSLIAVASRDATLSLVGITLAGMLIGALGVLADTAVTQASAVMALRRIDPTLGGRRLFAEAFTVGRDHLSATIHTLVLAYAGATLPLLLVLTASNVGTTDALNNQSIASPIVATAVGCLALICAVPLATGLAALLVARLPADILPAGHHHHH